MPSDFIITSFINEVMNVLTVLMTTTMVLLGVIEQQKRAIYFDLCQQTAKQVCVKIFQETVVKRNEILTNCSAFKGLINDVNELHYS